MRLSAFNNTVKGSFFGILMKLFQMLLPFISRTIFFYILGAEYLGLNSLFTSIIQTLNIAELGVSTALVFSMYKPIAQNETEKICALMNLYRKYYRIIGFVVLIIGLSLTPFLQYLINGDIPSDINLYIIYFLNLGATVLSYWMFAYRNSLFTAHQRYDVINIVGLLTTILKFIFEIIILFCTKNYYLYLTVGLFTQILQNLIIAILSKKMYPNYIPSFYLDKEEKHNINRKVKDLFYSKIGFVISNSFDSIVVSAFFGLSTLAIYQNYYYIINSAIAIFTIIFHSMQAGLGNRMLLETQDTNFSDFKKVTLAINVLFTFSIPCLLCMYQPFMKIWMDNDENYILNYQFVILFVIYFWLYEQGWLLQLYKDAIGKWHKDRFRPLITAIINLGLNILLVNYIGLIGVILSSALSYLFINLPWVFDRLFKDVFNSQNKMAYVILFIKNFAVILISSILSIFVTYLIPYINNYFSLIINFVVCVVISSIVLIISNYKNKDFKFIISKLTIFIKNIFRKQN